MRVTRFNFVSGWGVKLAKSYDALTDTLTVEVHATGGRGQKGDKGDPGAAGANGMNGTNGTNGTNGADGHDGYFPPLTADPAPPYAGYGYLNTLTAKIAIWDGSSWWRTAAVQDIGSFGAFDPIYYELYGVVDLANDAIHPLEVELFN